MSIDQLVRLATYYGDGRLLAALAEAWDEGCAAGLREANDKARGVQNNPAINPYERGD